MWEVIRNTTAQTSTIIGVQYLHFVLISLQRTFDVHVCPLSATERFLLQPFVGGTVFHASQVTADPPLSILCCRLKSHLFSLSYPAFWLFAHLCSARAVTRHLGHSNRYNILTFACFDYTKTSGWKCIPSVSIAAWVDVPSDIADASAAVVAIDTWQLSCRYVIADWSPRRQDATRLSLDSGQLLLSRSLHRYWRNQTGFTTATTSTRRCAVYTGSIRYIRHQSLGHSTLSQE